MPKSKIQKQEILRTLDEQMKRSKSVIFTGFNALGVSDNEALRAQLRAVGGEYYVPKKTLLKKVLKDGGLDASQEEMLTGKVAAIFSYDDEVAAAKAVKNFSKGKEEKIFFLGGVMDGRLLSKEEAINLANIPGKQELYAKLLGSINAPVSGFVNVLAGNLRGLVNVLKALSEKTA
ncbi:MAG: 50S ribosomal protein L10 [Patescibacteria group bacterium]|nr:50S ribosomal protein L10 [Patescibacteria group bacterium]